MEAVPSPCPRLGIGRGWRMFLDAGIRKVGAADSVPKQGTVMSVLKFLIYGMRIWVISKAPFSTENLLNYPQIFVMFTFTILDSTDAPRLTMGLHPNKPIIN